MLRALTKTFAKIKNSAFDGFFPQLRTACVSDKPGQIREFKPHYYVISINSPILAHTLEDAKREMDKLGEPEGFSNGMFQRQCGKNENAIYLFEFLLSKPASKATKRDFIFDQKFDETDAILSPTHSMSFIDIEVFSRASVDLAFQQTFEEMVTKYTTAAVDRILKLNKQDEIPVVVQSLVGQTAIPKMDIPPLLLPEVAHNSLMFTALSEQAQKLGFMVFSNKSNIIGYNHTHSSRFYLSRPDLVMYSHKSVKGFVAITTMDEDEKNDDEEDKDEENETTDECGIVRGWMAESKAKPIDALGQLLAGMEKVAGDLVYLRLRDYDLPISKRIFHTIEILGLLINFDSSSCKVCKLIMDFNTGQSTVFFGKDPLHINDGINRLLSNLNQEK